jgi:hypothetical protein
MNVNICVDHININEFILYIKHYAKNIIIFCDLVHRKANQAYEFIISVYFLESNVQSRLKLTK